MCFGAHSKFLRKCVLHFVYFCQRFWTQFLINYVFVFTSFVTFLVPNLGGTPLPGPHFEVQAGPETLWGAQGWLLDDF